MEPRKENPPLISVAARTAAEVCRRARLRSDALELLRADQTPRQFLDVLLAREKYADAIKFLAAALSTRQAVWWGCLCIQLAGGNELSVAEKAAVRAAARWALDASEINRQEAARCIVKNNPAGALAQAVGWTGGSLSKPGLPVVPPDPQLPASALTGALLQAAVRCPPAKIKDRFRHFLVLGIGIARKKQLQAPGAPAPPAPKTPPRPK